MFGKKGGGSNQSSPRVAGLRKNLSASDQLSTTSAFLGFKPSAAFDNRKRANVGLRKWLKFDRSGQSSIMQADKYAITHQLGVQLRDLRLLDPQLATSYPSAILARDKALVINLEFIKCIITQEAVLVLNPEEESVITFVEELQRRLTPPPRPAKGMAASYSTPELSHLSAAGADGGANGAARSEAADLFSETDTPFELRALEVVLDVVCHHLERATGDLEAAAHPALDALTHKVTTHNLERVRRVKNRMVRLKTRVETIREVLEKYLDDDDDMKDMNLTAKAQEVLQRASSQMRQSIELPANQPPSPLGFPDYDSDDDDVNDVEMLLEAYFMQVDNTYNKLQTLTEYIDDTEDYINIELDSHRNQLIQLELLLTTGMFALAIITVVAGIFGMNLANNLNDSFTAFLVVTIGSCVAAVITFTAIVMFCRYKKLLCY